MARDVESQRNPEACNCRNALEVMVDVIACVAVSGPVVRFGIADNRKQIGTPVLGIFVENTLHLPGPLDSKELACLAAAVSHASILQVCLLKIDHVDEAHSAEIEAHHKHITCIVEGRRARKVQHLYSAYRRQGQRALHRLVDSGINASERIAILDKAFLHRPVIDSSEDAGIERNRIQGNAPALMPGLISLHCFGTDAVQHYILVGPVFPETVEGRNICLGSPYPTLLPEAGDYSFHEIEKRIFFEVSVVFIDQVVGSIGNAAFTQLTVDSDEALEVRTYAVADGDDQLPALVRAADGNHRTGLVPLGRIDLVDGRKLSHLPFVDNLIVDRALAVGDRRRMELYFNRSHCAIV